MRTTRRWLGPGAAALLAALVAPASAQEAATPADAAASAPRAGDPDFYGAQLGDDAAAEIVGDERVIYAVGGIAQPVWLRQRGFELRCGAAVLWGDRDRLVESLQRRDAAEGAAELLGPVVHALYAEGDVLVRMPGQTLRGTHVFLDFRTGRAYLVDAELRGTAGEEAGRRIPFAVRADIVRGTARDRYEAEGARFTTCDYDDPHYAFVTDRLELDFSNEYVAFETGWWPALRVDTPLGDDVPVLALPKLGGRTFETRPLQSIDFGRSDRFGTSLELTWGGDLRDDGRAKWGDWRLHTDYRSRRGAGIGVDLDLIGDEHGGEHDALELRSMFQRDSARVDDYSERPFDGRDHSRHDRGRFALWGRQRGGEGALLPDGWVLEGALATYSDRGYLPEYERDRTATGPQQETFLSARGAWGDQGVSLLASGRIDDEAVALVRRPDDLFLTDYAVQTQALPSLTYHLIGRPIVSADTTGFAPVVLSVQANASEMDRDYDEVTETLFKRTLGWHHERTARGDLETRVDTPFSLGPIRVVPSFGGSATAYDAANGFGNRTFGTRDIDSDERWSSFGAVRAGVEAHRVFSDVESSALSLHGLRHVVSLDTQYFQRFAVSEESDSFQANDLIDPLDEVEIGSVRLRNRLQTKRDGEVVDWLDYEVRFLEFFDDYEAARAPFGLREDLPQPLQRLDLPGEEKYAGRLLDGAAYHQHRARLALLPRVWLFGEGDYDMDRERWETTGAGMRWAIDDRLSVYLGRRAIFDDSRIWTLRADYRLTGKWTISVQQQENTRQRDRSFDTKISLYRRAHDLTVAFEFDSDHLLDSTSVSLAVYPNDWLGSGGDPLAKQHALDWQARRWYR
mgnify:CR=1 FL=1